MLENIINRLKVLQIVVSDNETAKRISLAAAVTVLAKMKRRIFTDGLASDGSAIGSYSEEPFYQNPTKLVGVPTGAVKPQGKNGLPLFKNGNQKKTRYLEKGYKELRGLVGRQSKIVDLNFSGSTQQSFQFGFRGDVAVVGFINSESADIMEQNETRFNKTITEPTEEEQELGATAARNELLAIIEEL